MVESFDYIIVGAGSAGCVLAHRLGEDPDVRILVLEAGGADRSPIIKIPLTWGLILKHRMFDWGYFTEPEPGMDGRRIECARGKVVGGCTSINGMAYARGIPEDYDHWANDLGLKDWSYDRVLPYFKHSESWEAGESELRGGSGPLTVETLRFEDPLVEAFLNATDRAGHGRTDDYNGARSDGFGPMQATLRRGLRCSAAVAYLRPALARGNITLRTGALATQVLFEGARAAGLAYRRGGATHEIRAERGVLLCGGVINSPQLLMLSGIGDPAELRRHGIAVRAALSGVGRNLQDHVVCDVRWRRRTPGPLHRGLRLDRIGIDLMRAFLFGTGLASRIPAAAVGLVRSQPDVALPDAQFILAAGPMNAAPHLEPFLKAYTDAFGIKGVMLQPESHGTVQLASADPTVPAVIRQNFLATEGDRQTIRAMVRRMREIGAQAPLQPFIAEELAPGAGQTTDAEIDAFVRRTAITLHHPVGTCRMGADGDDDAVLDGRMRVRGIEGLRVVDGSALPRVVRGPTNAPILMMAEKIADDLRGRSNLPPH
ncbi:dehydrogenase [Aliidongia dinghuensis]|uniref:Dehydrogenase n=1 Tax=Aliidongia dinghuensis TaxID=1867774 RepID=A0A8J2YRU1_9PROT|nr:GMC family oxidoreductase N-terminal domain-containing protein [Aliidongia dinghuensis]GGF11028.1 dehydrogenase [Aliidongia dinghuensis]